MDPAVALATAVACCALASWLLLSLPRLGRSVAAVRIPVGPMAGLVAGSLLLVSVVRERPARAVTPPPVVRLGTAAPGPHPAPASPSGPTGESQAEHVVVAGDSLWAIARRHLEAVIGEEPSSFDVDRLWRAIYAENRQIVGDDPDLIFPGQRLRLPKV